MDDRRSVAPWLDEAAEVWGAVLQPSRHKGRANYLTPAEPDKFFESVAAPPPAESPAVVLTSIGFDTGGLDMARVADVALGTGAVRASMTAVPGLYCRHSFFFPGVLARDVITVSFWHNVAAVHAFAYQHGPHRRANEQESVVLL